MGVLSRGGAAESLVRRGATMANGDAAEVMAIHRLEVSPLTLERSRPEPRRADNPEALEEVKVKLQAKGLRLGQVEMPPPTSSPEPSPPHGPAEVVVVTSGERFIAPCG